MKVNNGRLIPRVVIAVTEVAQLNKGLLRSTCQCPQTSDEHQRLSQETSTLKFPNSLQAIFQEELLRLQEGELPSHIYLHLLPLSTVLGNPSTIHSHSQYPLLLNHQQTMSPLQTQTILVNLVLQNSTGLTQSTL